MTCSMLSAIMASMVVTVAAKIPVMERCEGDLLFGAERFVLTEWLRVDVMDVTTRAEINLGG